MADDYGELYSIAEYTGGQAELCACGQYADYSYDKVYDKMTESIEKGYYIVVEGLGKVDVDKFAKTLASNIYEAGLKNIDFNELVAEIQEQLKVSEEEAKANEIIYLDRVKTDFADFALPGSDLRCDMNYYHKLHNGGNK